MMYNITDYLIGLKYYTKPQCIAYQVNS